jgi:hypothetical protein
MTTLTRRCIQIIVVTASLVLGVQYAFAQQRPQNPGRETKVLGSLNGYQETPTAKSTTGFGTFEAFIDDESQTITYSLTYEALETPAFQAHIHFGARHTTGGVAAFLCGGGDKPPCPATTGTVTGVIDATDVIGPSDQGIEPGSMPELIRAIRAGITYANVHTARFTGGEIRGQLNDRGNVEFVD